MVGDTPRGDAAPNANASSPAHAPPPAAGGSPGPGGKAGRRALILGAIGVVFGDIGTSPIYALREAIGHAQKGVDGDLAVIGVVSLAFWALMVVVTFKYVMFLMRADNKGEGGTLSLMALAQHAIGRRSAWLFILGVCGAALFYSDGVITPAISVLSAIEGLQEAPGLNGRLDPFILPLAAGILIALFLVQSRGTAGLAKFFGPITLVWFLSLGLMGVAHIFDDLSILKALSPYYGIKLLVADGFLGFVILGSVFLAVTGAEALYADMGHFGKSPIRQGWLFIVLPCLTLNYLGQGAFLLSHPGAANNPFWNMVPQLVYWPMLLLATAATVIASQAVITGAFSVTQQAVQLGLLPRLDIRNTSETQAGQIYVPAINSLLMVGVLFVLVTFQSSHNLTAAYGVAVTGTMMVNTLMSFTVVRHKWKWPMWAILLTLVPFGFIDAVFLTSNLLKIPAGAWMPLVLGGGLVMLMWTWVRGTQILTDKTRKDSLPLTDLIEMLRARPPHRAPGTAIFLTSDAEVAPVALMHNLKHNKVLHERVILLTLRTEDAPYVHNVRRVQIEQLSPTFWRVVASYGWRETPNVEEVFHRCGLEGLSCRMMETSFFMSHESLIIGKRPWYLRLRGKLYLILQRNALRAPDQFEIPPNRVIELGTQVEI
nr:potassium transporter Kup [Brevundimonas naejangsanensis]